MRLALTAILILTASAATAQIHPSHVEQVEEWQAVASNDLGDGVSPLAASYRSYRAEWDNQELTKGSASALLKFVQKLSRRHYVSDGEGQDNWTTIAEVMARGEDDCDGLDLLIYWAMVDAGADVERVIFYHPLKRMAHMVTVWHSPEGRSFVLDSTGAMDSRMRPVGFFKSWAPVTTFSH